MFPLRVKVKRGAQSMSASKRIAGTEAVSALFRCRPFLSASMIRKLGHDLLRSEPCSSRRLVAQTAGRQRYNRIFERLLLTGLLLVGASLPTVAAAADAIKLKCGYSAGFLTDPFQAVLVESTLKAATAAGMQPLPATNANGDSGKQISDVRSLLAAGAQGLIVVATDSQAIVPGIDFAATKNEPVVAIDMAPAGGKVAMIVRADNHQMGEEAGKEVGSALGGKGTVLSLMGDQATTNGRDRTTGFSDYMKANYPDIKIIEKPTYWKTEKATAAAQTVVTSTPNLSAIYMQSAQLLDNISNSERTSLTLPT